MSFFFNDTATTEIYTLSLHDALPICISKSIPEAISKGIPEAPPESPSDSPPEAPPPQQQQAPTPQQQYLRRSEEHTSELQSRQYLVCRLLLEKKKPHYNRTLVTLLSH